jgi:glycosyltransferase involved in cell wall biosynthesis
MNDRRNKNISLIIPVKNEGLHLKRTISSIIKSNTNHHIEIIVVDDASTDHCCEFLSQQDMIKTVKTSGVGSAQARNIGAKHANGDYLIFCDGHIFFEDYVIDRLLEPLVDGIADAINPGIADSTDGSRKGFGYRWNSFLEPKWNTGIKELTVSPLLAGGTLAIPGKIFFDIGGFETGFKVWGREDEEISLKLWLFGYKCFVHPIPTVIHVFRTGAPPFELNWDDINYNMMRMAFSHFNEERIDKCIRLIKHSDPEKIVSRVLNSDVLKQRELYFNRRIYDDEWYFNIFGIRF